MHEACIGVLVIKGICHFTSRTCDTIGFTYRDLIFLLYMGYLGRLIIMLLPVKGYGILACLLKGIWNIGAPSPPPPLSPYRLKPKK